MGGAPTYKIYVTTPPHTHTYPSVAARKHLGTTAPIASGRQNLNTLKHHLRPIHLRGKTLNQLIFCLLIHGQNQQAFCYPPRARSSMISASKPLRIWVWRKRGIELLARLGVAGLGRLPPFPGDVVLKGEHAGSSLPQACQQPLKHVGRKKASSEVDGERAEKSRPASLASCDLLPSVLAANASLLCTTGG